VLTPASHLETMNVVAVVGSAKLIVDDPLKGLTRYVLAPISRRIQTFLSVGALFWTAHLR
jgi:hypothetical protein